MDDRVHVLVSVIPAATVSLINDEVKKKMREVRLAAREMGKNRIHNGYYYSVWTNGAMLGL